MFANRLGSGQSNSSSRLFVVHQVTVLRERDGFVKDSRM